MELSFGGWIYTYSVSLNLATVTTAGYPTSLYWAALTLGRLVTIPLAARVRPRYLLMADIAGMIFFLGLLLLFLSQPGIVWLAAFGMGFSMANVFPTLILLGGRHLPVTGNITSWYLVSGSLGSMARAVADRAALRIDRPAGDNAYHLDDGRSGWLGACGVSGGYPSDRPCRHVVTPSDRLISRSALAIL